MDNNKSTRVFLLLLLFLVSIINVTNASDIRPVEWTKRIQQAQMFYTEQEPTNQQLFPYVGNGYIATQISSDSIYVGGVFNGPADSPKDPSHRARIPSFVNFEIVAASSNKHGKQMWSSIEVVGSTLDVERGIYFRRVQITTSTSSTEKVMLEQRWYAHRQYRNLLVHEIYPVSSIKTHQLHVCFHQNMGSASTDLSLKSVQNSTSYQSWIGYTLIPEVDTFPLVGLAIVSTPLNRTAKTHCVDFTPDSQNPFTYLLVVNTTLDAQKDGRQSPPMERIVNDSVKNFITYQKLSAIPSKKYASEISMCHALLDSHIDAWNEVWRSGIEVQSVHRDDIQLARAINSSQYYILSSVRDDWPYSLSPGSLSSDAYHGHVFWDTETWMFPPLLMLHPSIARNGILQYRVDRIKEAEEKAKSYKGRGYLGAMYPWESAASGVETCPTVAPTGLLEQHISGDIVFAIKQLYRTQIDCIGEDQFKNQFLRLVVQVARFYTSRVTPRPNSHLFDINGVIPPDEYAVNVNNSIYTNVIAQISLDFAVELVNKFKDPSVPISEVHTWSRIATNLFLPYDTEKGIHPEYEGYRGELIKQADVALLKFPLMWPGYNSVPQSVRADLEFYEKVTDIKEGPAMTFGMYAVGWIDEGELKRAAPLFAKSYANIHEPFGVWTETPTGGAVNFITGAGGFLQSLLFGYGGLRIIDPLQGPSSACNVRKIRFNPVLPPNISHVRFRSLHFMGNIFTVEYDAETIIISSTVISRSTGTFIEYPDGQVEKLGDYHTFARGDGPFLIYAP